MNFAHGVGIKREIYPKYYHFVFRLHFDHKVKLSSISQALMGLSRKLANFLLILLLFLKKNDCSQTWKNKWFWLMRKYDCKLAQMLMNAELKTSVTLWLRVIVQLQGLCCCLRLVRIWCHVQINILLWRTFVTAWVALNFWTITIEIIEYGGLHRRII